MKYLLAALSGFVLTLGVFVGGVAFTLLYLTADPVPVQQPSMAAMPAFTTEPIRVKTGGQDLQRVEGLPLPEALPPAGASEPALHIDPVEPEPAISDVTTASLAVAGVPGEEAAADSGTNEAHVAWCSQRYRSYRQEDNRYTSYSGEDRECISPYSGGADAIYVEASAGRNLVEIGQDHASSAYLSAEHIEACYDRYRSYRPDDNTYQPYGGGPRRQCR